MKINGFFKGVLFVVGVLVYTLILEAVNRNFVLSELGMTPRGYGIFFLQLLLIGLFVWGIIELLIGLAKLIFKVRDRVKAKGLMVGGLGKMATAFAGWATVMIINVIFWVDYYPSSPSGI